MELLRGGRAPLEVPGARITVQREGEESSAVDAVVVEEDRYLTLSAQARVDLDARENRLRTLTRGFDAEPAELGTLILRQGRPLVMLAIVVDVDADAPVLSPHVGRAYERVIAVCRAQSLTSLRTPLLGRRGRFDLDASARLLLAALASFHAESGAQLDVAIPHPPGDVDRLASMLRAQG